MMTLDLGLVTALLIEYDVEHPTTLGEYADRRAIYAKRIVEMSKTNALVPEKFRVMLGDGVNRMYTVHHPFGRGQIIVQAYMFVDGTPILIGDQPDKYDGYVVYGFPRAIDPGEVIVTITG